MEETSAPCGKYVMLLKMPHEHYNRNGAHFHIIVLIDLRYAKSFVCRLIFVNPLSMVLILVRSVEKVCIFYFNYGYCRGDSLTKIVV